MKVYANGAEQMSDGAVTRPSRRRRVQPPSGSTTCDFCTTPAKYRAVTTGLEFCERCLLTYYFGLHYTGA